MAPHVIEYGIRSAAPDARALKIGLGAEDQRAELEVISKLTTAETSGYRVATCDDRVWVYVSRQAVSRERTHPPGTAGRYCRHNRR